MKTEKTVAEMMQARETFLDNLDTVGFRRYVRELSNTEAENLLNAIQQEKRETVTA